MRMFQIGSGGIGAMALVALTACADEGPLPPSEDPTMSLDSPVVGCCGAGSADPNTNGLRLGLGGHPVSYWDDAYSVWLGLVPFKSRNIALFDGDNWVMREVASEFGPNTSLLPRTANTTYDVYAYWTGTEVALELVPWPSSTGTMHDGVLVKNGDPTRRYLGAAATDSGNWFRDSYKERLLWNRYNQVPRYIDTAQGDTWVYTNANSVWREAKGGTSWTHATVVIGAGEPSYVSVQAAAMGYPTTNATGNIATGIGIDSTTWNVAQVNNIGITYTSGVRVAANASYTGHLTAGFHTIYWLETGYGAINYTFIGTASDVTHLRVGLSGWIMM